MKRISLILLLALLSCDVEPNASAPEPVPGGAKVSITEPAKPRKPTGVIPARLDLPSYATADVAKVNGRLISAKTFNEYVQEDRSRAYVGNSEPTDAGRLLDRLIEVEILAQAAEPHLPNVTENKLDAAYDMDTRWGGWAYTPQPEPRATELETGYLAVLERTRDQHRAHLRRLLAIDLMFRKDHPLKQSDIDYQMASARPTYRVGFVRFDRVELSNKKTKRALKRANKIRDRLTSGASLDEIETEFEQVVVRRRYYTSPASNPHLMELAPGEVSEPYEQLGKVMVARVIESEPTVQNATDEQAIEMIKDAYYRQNGTAFRNDALQLLRPKATIERYSDSVHSNPNFSMTEWRKERNALPPLQYD